MLTRPSFTLYGCSVTPLMDEHLLQTLIFFLFLFLFIRLLFSEKLFRGAFLISLLIIQGSVSGSPLTLHTLLPVLIQSLLQLQVTSQ